MSGAELSAEERRAKLAARLAMRPSNRDTGECLPATARALDLPAMDEAGAAERLEALTAALAVERLVVPVAVEADPRETGVHANVEPDSCDAADFLRERTPMGEALVAFSSVRELAAFDPSARPMTLRSRTVALAALVETAGRVLVDPRGAAVLLPRPAVAALAQGDEWLPAWRDEELLVDLRACAWAWAVPEGGVRVVPTRGGAAVRVEVDVPVAAGEDPSLARVRATELVEALRRVPRLSAAADRVEFAPRPVPAV